MTYDPRSISQAYEQYGRSKAKQTTKSSGLGSKLQRTSASTAAANRQSAAARSQAAMKSLMAKSSRGRSKTKGGRGSVVEKPGERVAAMEQAKPTVREKIDKAFVNTLLSFVPDFKPKKKPSVYPLQVYGGPLFTVPAPAPVTVQELDAAARDTTRTFSPPSMPSPTLPTPTTDPSTGVTAPRGLMAPPTMTQPEKPKGLMGIPRGLAKAYAVPTAAYQIQSGDTLSEIAAATGTTVKELAELNQISDVDVIEAGADIQIPIKRLQDESIVTQAKSMEDLKPIKTGFKDVDPDSKFYNSFNEEVGSSPERFILRLAGSESSGNPDAEYTVEDGRRFVGLLQFGKARLTDYKRETGAKFTQDEFKKDLKLQGEVSVWHINDIDKTIDSIIDNSAFKNRDGLRAVAHLGGKTGMRKFVESNGEYNPEDELGTSLLDYYMKFSN